jgi:hypothetical protein
MAKINNGNNKNWMKGILLTLILICCPVVFFAQAEEVGPLTGNPDLYGKKSKLENSEKANPGTFDSTFIYKSDTLDLPFFDEFTKNHFEVYDADYADLGVTSDKKYRILDNATSIPIANNLYFSGQATFRRTFDVLTSTYTDLNFSPTQYKVGSLATYPVSYVTTDLYPPYYIYDTIGTPDVSDTIWIVTPEFFQDSATQFFANLNNSEAYWLDNQAYHNYRFAVNPNSLGVVTFDGLDETGYPYAIGTTLTNYADFLTSKPLDLSTVNAADSVYLSFLYQTEGFGDIPESTDSLVLEFYAKDLDQWNRIWSAQGQANSDFKLGHILLEDPLYFEKGFQFRFKNYGALSGSLDHFHIDYVHLRALSGYQDTVFKDLAFVYPIGSLLKTYTSVPWDHFKNNSAGKMNDAVSISMHNGAVIQANNDDGLIEISYSGFAEGNFVLNGQILAGGVAPFNYQPGTNQSFHDLSGGYIYDITKLGNYQTFDILATASTPTTTANDYTLNDSTSGIQYFANYYSYDDGSAEAAYGPTGVQSRLAIKYNAYEADSIIGLNIHFVPSVTDVSNKLFLLTVWIDNAGVPGAVLYEDDVFFPRQPEYGSNRNEFITYYFEDTLKVPVGLSYFVGWRQFDANRLNVGLDRNLDNSSNTYYSVNNGVSWNQSTFPGSVMIRPIYSTSMDVELTLEETNAEPIVKLYPNPTSDEVNISIENRLYTGVEVYSIQGSLMYETIESKVSLIDFPSGVYFFRVKGIDSVYKIIKY